MVLDLSGKVCLVTGGSRGLGKGIAVQLAVCGAKCYVTGRNLEPLEKLNEEVENLGGSGTCFPIQCDHQDDNAVKAVFQHIAEDNDGRLDLLVNNAYSAVQYLFDNLTNFWEQPEDMWDSINNVGLRNQYLCSVYAARIMAKRKQGLIINMSSLGGTRYLFSAPYGVGKAAMDKMARYCSMELHNHGVAFVSLLPGLVKTELMYGGIVDKHFKTMLGPYMDKVETPTYVGKVVTVLLAESQADLMSRSGKTLLTTDIGRRYGVVDENGEIPVAMNQLNFNLYANGYHTLSKFIPDFVRIPLFFIKLSEVAESV